MIAPRLREHVAHRDVRTVEYEFRFETHQLHHHLRDACAARGRRHPAIVGEIDDCRDARRIAVQMAEIASILAPHRTVQFRAEIQREVGHRLAVALELLHPVAIAMGKLADDPVLPGPRKPVGKTQASGAPFGVANGCEILMMDVRETRKPEVGDEIVHEPFVGELQIRDRFAAGRIREREFEPRFLA